VLIFSDIEKVCPFRVDLYNRPYSKSFLELWIISIKTPSPWAGKRVNADLRSLVPGGKEHFSNFCPSIEEKRIGSEGSF
jgi:hypothetical protein